MSRLVRSLPLQPSERSPLPTRRPTLAWRRQDFSLLGYGQAWRFDPGVGVGRFRRARDAWEEWLSGAEVDDQVGQVGSGPVGFGSFTFDPRAPGSVLAVPSVLVGRHADRHWITTVGDADLSGCESHDRSDSHPDRPRYVGATHPDWEWMESVARAVRMIESDVLRKVVLARDVKVWSKRPFDAGALVQRLHRAHPGCFTFLVEGLVGASPELLLRQRRRQVESVALAGTAPRDPDSQRDRQLAADLLASPKDRLEHDLTAASVRDSLGEVCSRLTGSGQPTIRELATLRHLATSFSGHLAQAMSCFEVLSRLHPTAAVGGVPRQAAFRAIADLEGIDRGGYAGPVGWFDQTGGGEWAIALRCAQLTRTGARLFAGAGIVAGSLPEEELAETRLKLRAMSDALDLR